MFKKTTTIIVLAALCLNFSLSAQQKAKTKYPQIGEKIPDIHLENILNHTSTTAKLSDFKNKAIILDYWATWCGSCIKAFPKMDSLQQQFKKNLQIILINNSKRDNTSKVEAFLAKFKIEHPNFSLPITMSNEHTQTLFHIGVLPHYIWIGHDRKIKAITSADEVKLSNIERLVAGLPLNLPIKEGYHE